MADRPIPIEPTEDEDAAIEAAVASDPDAQVWDDDAPWVSASDMHPEMIESWRRTRGRQKLPTKEMITIRLDADVVDYFRATGKGWQGRVNEALRRAAFGE